MLQSDCRCQGESDEWPIETFQSGDCEFTAEKDALVFWFNVIRCRNSVDGPAEHCLCSWIPGSAKSIHEPYRASVSLIPQPATDLMRMKVSPSVGIVRQLIEREWFKIAATVHAFDYIIRRVRGALY
jgi:hypothetical protein